MTQQNNITRQLTSYRSNGQFQSSDDRIWIKACGHFVDWKVGSRMIREAYYKEGGKRNTKWKSKIKSVIQFLFTGNITVWSGTSARIKIHNCQIWFCCCLTEADVVLSTANYPLHVWFGKYFGQHQDDKDIFADKA